MEKDMSVLKIARTAAAAAALAMLPVHAAAAPLPVLASASAVQTDDTATAEDDGQPFFTSEYLVPTLIVIALALAFYFLLGDDEDTTGAPGVSP